MKVGKIVHPNLIKLKDKLASRLASKKFQIEGNKFIIPSKQVQPKAFLNDGLAPRLKNLDQTWKHIVPAKEVRPKSIANSNLKPRGSLKKLERKIDQIVATTRVGFDSSYGAALYKSIKAIENLLQGQRWNRKIIPSQWLVEDKLCGNTHPINEFKGCQILESLKLKILRTPYASEVTVGEVWKTHLPGITYREIFSTLKRQEVIEAVETLGRGLGEFHKKTLNKQAKPEINCNIFENAYTINMYLTMDFSLNLKIDLRLLNNFVSYCFKDSKGCTLRFDDIGLGNFVWDTTSKRAGAIDTEFIASSMNIHKTPLYSPIPEYFDLRGVLVSEAFQSGYSKEAIKHISRAFKKGYLSEFPLSFSVQEREYMAVYKRIQNLCIVLEELYNEKPISLAIIPEVESINKQMKSFLKKQSVKDSTIVSVDNLSVGSLAAATLKNFFAKAVEVTHPHLINLKNGISSFIKDETGSITLPPSLFSKGTIELGESHPIRLSPVQQAEFLSRIAIETTSHDVPNNEITNALSYLIKQKIPNFKKREIGIGSGQIIKNGANKVYGIWDENAPHYIKNHVTLSYVGKLYENPKHALQEMISWRLFELNPSSTIQFPSLINVGIINSKYCAIRPFAPGKPFYAYYRDLMVGKPYLDESRLLSTEAIIAKLGKGLGELQKKSSEHSYMPSPELVNKVVHSFQKKLLFLNKELHASGFEKLRGGQILDKKVAAFKENPGPMIVSFSDISSESFIIHKSGQVSYINALKDNFLASDRQAFHQMLHGDGVSLGMTSKEAAHLQSIFDTAYFGAYRPPVHIESEAFFSLFSKLESINKLLKTEHLAKQRVDAHLKLLIEEFDQIANSVPL